VGTSIRPKMSVENRAKQFMPFAALRGLPEALAEKEKIVVEKITLTEDMAAELDWNMRDLCTGMIVKAVYFEKDQYLQKTGMISRLDKSARIIQIVDTKINFDDLLTIEKSN